MSIKPIHAAAALLCAFPATGWAASTPADTGSCPNVDQVIAAITPPSSWLTRQDLISQTGAAANDQAAVDALANSIETNVPQASQAEVADLLIASYCDYLTTSAPGTNLPASVRDFETTVYASLPGANAAVRPPAPRPDHGWLYSAPETGG